MFMCLSEAIEILKENKVDHVLVCELNIAIDIAIPCLEKQIPKPVKYLNRHGDGADLWNKDYFNCPSCGRRLRNKKPDPFCPRCGQALMWDV